MNLNQNPEMIFIDFDGVISKNSILLNIKSFHDFINQYTPFPYEALLSFCKNTMSFSMHHTISYLLSSIGLEDKISACFQEINQLVSHHKEPVKIVSDFNQFLDFCAVNSIRYLIFSSRDHGVKKIQELADKIGNHIYDLNSCSKANPNTYLEVADKLGLDLKKCIQIDDTPLALRTGKLQGMTTVMMLNDVFTVEDYQIFRSFIDCTINSFTEFIEIFRNKY